jgi:23S rRNA pseudouridine2605 synthase
MSEKIHKVLARSGLGSRREIETWIRAGRIRLNDRDAVLGDRIGPQDRVYLDGKQLALKWPGDIPVRVIAYNKPEGVLCSRRDTRGRPTVFEQLPEPEAGRWISIGRLDINTSGLLLLTNNGELANRLMHPSSRVQREYAVRVFGEVDEAKLALLRKGVQLEDGKARFDHIKDRGGQGANHWYHVVLSEGRKREVRRLWEAVGVKVSRLIRIRFGPLKLKKELAKGEWQMLGKNEVEKLCKAAGLD